MSEDENIPMEMQRQARERMELRREMEKYGVVFDVPIDENIDERDEDHGWMDELTKVAAAGYDRAVERLEKQHAEELLAYEIRVGNLEAKIARKDDCITSLEKNCTSLWRQLQDRPKVPEVPLGRIKPLKERPDFLAGYDAGMADAKGMYSNRMQELNEAPRGPMKFINQIIETDVEVVDLQSFMAGVRAAEKHYGLEVTR